MKKILIVCLNPTFQRTLKLKQINNGEVNRAYLKALDISGKGINTTRVLQQLGAKSRHLTHLGPQNQLFLDMGQKENLDIVWEPSPSKIRNCITLINDEKNEITEIIEPSESVDDSTVKRIRTAFYREIEDVDWVVFAGTRPGGYPSDLYRKFAGHAQNCGVKTLADFWGKELSDCRDIGLTTVKINLVEFVRTFLPGLAARENKDQEVVGAVKQKMIELSLRGCDYIVTRGERDVFFARKGKFDRCSPKPVKVVNSVGSGDAFTAGFLYALSRDSDFEEALREGIRCGGLNASIFKPGSIITD